MELNLNESNPRTIKKEAFNKLKKSLKEFPQMLELRPIIYDDTLTILGGNMRYRALKELENEGFEIKDSWFKNAKDLTERQKREFVIKDNVPFGEWDDDVLANEWSDLPLEEWGIDTSGWKPDEVTEDEAPEVSQEEPKSKLGEVYQLGRHRLMCGDSTKIEDVEKLMNGQKADSDSDVWDVYKDTNYQHPTQKPVELPARAIKNSSKQDDIVLDLFGGSGSTLIACEQLNRTCYMMELDPKYVDVIRKRYAKFIGREAEWETITPIVKQ